MKKDNEEVPWNVKIYLFKKGGKSITSYNNLIKKNIIYRVSKKLFLFSM